MKRPGPLGLLLCAGVLLATSCAAPPSTPVPAGPSAGSAGSTSDSAVGSGPKTIRLAVDANSEPSTGMVLIGRSGTVALENFLLFHAGLTVWDQNSTITPRLAERVPSLENGDWMVLPDGRVDVTWHLRPDAVWHDSTPLTADDFVFGNTIRTDRNLGITTGPPARLIDSVSAPDPHTFVVHWKQPYVYGNSSVVDDFAALPRHLMERVYQQGDKDSFLANSFWTTGWVGLGPYRISNWALGSQLEATAFDQYVLGRPKIDRVIMQYFGTPNGAVAALLSGAVDMTPIGSSYNLDQLVTVKNAWDPAQAGTTLPVPRGVRNLKLQFRDPTAPWAQDVSVRRAIAYATDRQAIVDTLLYGLSTTAYTWVATDDPVYPLLQQRGFTPYVYDPIQAARLLADAGWTKAADGVYQRNGQRFQIDAAALARSNAQEASALAGQWSQLGFVSSPSLIQASATNTQELTSTYQGVITWPGGFRDGAIRDWTSEQISTADTRWRGGNFGAYSNPQMDQLYDRFQVALQTSEQQQILADALKLANDDLPMIATYIYVVPVMFRKGVVGPGKVSPNQLASAWNVHTWEIN